MESDDLLARLKTVFASCQHDLKTIVAWCIRRAKVLFCAVSILVILHFIQKLYFASDQWKTVKANRFSAVKNTLSARQTDEIIAESLPSLPYLTWKANKDQRWHLKCGQYPNIFDVPFFNTYWQTFKLRNYTLQIFGAYFDNRPIFGGKSFVRIHAMITGYMPNLNGLQGNKSDPILAHCQLWFDSQMEPVVANVSSVKYTWQEKWGVDKSGGYEPHLLSCELPSSHEHAIPASVSLVENACDKGTNHLKVMNERPTDKRPKSEFGVCVKNLMYPFEDKSVRFIEWIELQLAMGATQIYFYIMDVHPNIEKVLKYYEAQGKIRVSYMTYPSGSPNVRGLPLEYKNQNGKTVKWETISLNDCYYRNMYKHKFLAMLDPDEVLMPKKHYRSWYELFDSIEYRYNITRDDYNSFNFQHSYFLDYPDQEPVQDIPSSLYMFQHVDRVAKYSKFGAYIKSFHSTANCYAVHNHYPMLCVENDWYWCKNFWLKHKFAQLNHYRNDCHRYNNTCDQNIDKRVKDKHIWKFKKAVVPRAMATMSALNLV